MKNFNITVTTLIVVICFIHSGCKKDKLCEDCNTNKTPIAKAGADQIITLPVNSATLNGQSSSDPDGSIQKWRWNKIAGPANSTIQQPDSSLTTVNQLSAGVYAFELIVTDDKGIAAKDTMRVFVDPVATSNRPPIAVAGPDMGITLPVNAITLDGRASSDPENNITGQLWTKISGPAAVITNTGILLTSVIQMVEGIYEFELKLIDSGGLVGRDTIRVTVQNIGNAPQANAGPDQTVLLPMRSTILNGSGSIDFDNNIVSYLWTKVSGPMSFQFHNPSNVQTIVSQLTEGVYQFQLTVTDAGGLTDTDTISVILRTPGNHPPSANAGPDKVITLPVHIVSLNGYYSTDPENNITGYAWTQIAGPTQSTNASPTAGNTQMSNLSQGTYQFELTVTDRGGLSSKDSVNVVVLPRPTSSPAVFDNLFWIGNCYLEIPGIYSFIPAGSMLQVQMKQIYQGQASSWFTVRMEGAEQPGDFGYYTIVNGSLKFHPISFDCSFDDSDSYSIRITY